MSRSGARSGFPANGAVSNLTARRRASVATLRRELRAGGYDVVHLHEPVAPTVGLGHAVRDATLPLVGTFHCYSENVVSNGIANAASARAGG